MTEYKLEEMGVQEVAEFLENFDFFTPAHTTTYGKGGPYERTYDYPDSHESGWFAVEEYAESDEGFETPIGRLEMVEQHGGEGQGDQYWIVIRLTQGKISRTFKKEGWYASHHGHEFDGFNSDTFSEVSQVQKTITVWE